MKLLQIIWGYMQSSPPSSWKIGEQFYQVSGDLEFSPDSGEGLARCRGRVKFSTLLGTKVVKILHTKQLF